MLTFLLGCLLLAEPPTLVADTAAGEPLSDAELGAPVAVGVGVWDVCVAYEHGNRCNGSAELPPGHTYVEVNGGLTGYCGITGEGELYCNTDDAADAPDGADAVAVGQFTGVAIEGGALRGWGDNDYRLADPPSGTGWSSVALGTYNGCAVADNGEVRCWGEDGFDVTDEPRGEFVSVATADFTACAVKADGDITCWGSTDGRPPSGSFVSIVAGDYHYCALAETGSVECWGDDDDQQSSPPSDHFEQIDCHGYGCCGITDAAEVACWGDVGDENF